MRRNSFTSMERSPFSSLLFVRRALVCGGGRAPVGVACGPSRRQKGVDSATLKPTKINVGLIVVVSFYVQNHNRRGGGKEKGKDPRNTDSNRHTPKKLHCPSFPSTSTPFLVNAYAKEPRINDGFDDDMRGLCFGAAPFHLYTDEDVVGHNLFVSDSYSV